MTDKLFIEKLKNKEKEAWEEAYHRYFPKVKSFLKRSSEENLKDAKDVCQEAIATLYIKIKQGAEIKDLGGYMYGIIRNKWLKKWSKNKEVVPIENHNQDLPEKNEIQDLERLKLSKEIVEDIFHLMRKTSGKENCVEIIKAPLYESKTDKDIAKVLGLNENYIRVRRHRVCMPFFIEHCKKHPKFLDLYN